MVLHYIKVLHNVLQLACQYFIFISLFDSRCCRMSSDRIPLFTLVWCAQEKDGRNKSLTKKVLINQLQVTPHSPPYNDQKSDCPLRLTDSLAPLNDALRSRGRVRVDMSASRV